MSNSRPPVPPRLLDQAAEIIRHGWLPEIAALGVRGETPPEDWFVFALRTLLLRELLEGRIHLVRNAPVLDTAAGTNYEVDVLLTQPLRRAELVIECQSYIWHGKGLTPEQHAYETERSRTLGTLRGRFLPFTGAEMLQPWTAALKVIDCINHHFPEFAPIHLPEAVLSQVRRFAEEALVDGSPRRPSTGDFRARAAGPATRLPARERVLRDLPPEILQQARQITGSDGSEQADTLLRLGASWTSAEDAVLRNALAYSQDTEVLAALLGRTGGAVAHRLARMGLLRNDGRTSSQPHEAR